MIMPAYNVTQDVVETIVDKFAAVLADFFSQLEKEHGAEQD